MDTQIRTAVVIIPAYNAEASIEELINRLNHSVKEARVVVVDDGSVDSTGEAAKSAGAFVLRHEKNRGKGAALQTGFDFVKSLTGVEFIVTMDADLQHQPEDVPNFFLVQKQTEADIVIGWRERIGTKMPALRILSNTITSIIVELRTGVSIKDSQCGFRLISRSVIEKIHLESAGYEAETEFLVKAARHGFKINFVPVITIYGSEKSHMTHWTTTMNFIKVIFRKYT